MVSDPIIRAPLFVPGNRKDMLAKVAKYSPDAILPDMEDAVPNSEKEAARQMISAALPALAVAGVPIIPRVNSLGTRLLKSDVNAVVSPYIAGISIGKITSASDIRAIDAVIAAAENQANLPSCAIGILPWLEMPAAILLANEIVTASPRIKWVAFGADDFTAEMGIERPAEIGSSNARGASEFMNEPGLLYPRSVVATAARAAALQAFDSPYVGFQDPTGLKAESLLARQMGFTGKCAIHPSQISIIREIFAPSEAELERARQIIGAWDEAERRGNGATSLDGHLIDTPVVERARRLLANSRQG